jgi:hypothetical protein
MLKQTSKEFKAIFLLQFTKELIKNTQTYQDFKLKEEVHSVIQEKEEERLEEPKYLIFPTQKKGIKNIIREKKKQEKKIVSQLKKEEKHPIPRPVPRLIIRRPVLRIPEPVLPPTVRYLKPAPTAREVDLEKLNPLVNDPLVRLIECNGPGENILVMGTMGRKSTNIILTKDDIDLVIQRFSEATHIPVHEGLFKVVRGKLIFSAIVSDLVGSKFIIKKMPFYNGFNNFQRNNLPRTMLLR